MTRKKPFTPPLYAMMCGCGKPMRLEDMRRLGHRIVCPVCALAGLPSLPRPSPNCHVETYRDDIDGRWGWECLTCSAGIGGLRSLDEAQTYAEGHMVAGLGGAA